MYAFSLNFFGINDVASDFLFDSVTLNDSLAACAAALAADTDGLLFGPEWICPFDFDFDFDLVGVESDPLREDETDDADDLRESDAVR